ncbi:hypothetical protein M413DRAFT_23449 [Hebeloma cylindrosporum]|uniref:Uncharacterized protein n=1 Tax=Hebeloma cylindrosporum TaxID=76867 RepID=A0A0C3CTL4_HEBCY|nr:hypothetical protein M413DRAFT_23449 [Hebeloma cylindrosporum h7]
MAHVGGQYHHLALPTYTLELELTLYDLNREPGASCRYNVDCNWGINCNGSFSPNGVCGGYGAYMNNMESYDGLDFGRDYCLSGKASQNNIGYWLCTGGPPMALTSPPLRSTTASNHKVSKALIAGVSVAGAVVLAAIVAFIIWRTRRDNESRGSPVEASMSNERSSSVDERKIADAYIPQSQSTPSPRPYAVSESIPPGLPTDNSSFSNPMIVAPPIMHPEIQSEDYPGQGTLPMRQTTTLGSMEKRTIMARQGPDAASNTNSGFYTSAISGSITTRPSSNQIYDPTRVPFNQANSPTMNTEFSPTDLYDTAKSPLKQVSEKDG